MTDMYADIILEHYKHPLNQGSLKNASISHEEYNALCGDRIKVQLLVEKDIITEVKFEGKGCAISIASTSLLTDAIKGKSINQIKKMNKKDVTNLLGIEVNPARIKCATIGLQAIKMALYKFLLKRKEKINEKEFSITDE